MQKLSKETTVQYLVTLLDEMLQESKQRVELFGAYSKKYKENVYGIFQKMLYRNDPFITHQICRIITKLACWSQELMADKELKDFVGWIKEQLDDKVCVK
jgi:V-type H+-transporting ATPase subunit H